MALVGQATGKVIGNSRSRAYHRPGCPNGEKISMQNRVQFATDAEAE
jgi:hypothetical protein